MKKLNKKGFTLIELLAVIVILAIVLVVTIPTVLSSMDNARKDTFKASATSAAEWFEKQAAADLLGSADNDYITFANGKVAAGNAATPKYTFFEKDAVSPVVLTRAKLDDNILSAAGLNGTDYDAENSCVYIKSNGRACVVLAVKAGGKFASLTGDDAIARSSVCSIVSENKDCDGAE